MYPGYRGEEVWSHSVLNCGGGGINAEDEGRGRWREVGEPQFETVGDPIRPGKNLVVARQRSGTKMVGEHEAVRPKGGATQEKSQKVPFALRTNLIEEEKNQLDC